MTTTKKTFNSYRIFRGSETEQVDPWVGESADADSWFWEPEDYDGDVLYSRSYESEDEATAAAETWLLAIQRDADEIMNDEV